MTADSSPYAFDVRESDFAERVLEASFDQPVLVDFWAPWCGPCRTLGPILEKLTAELGGRIRLAKVNSDEEQRLAGHFGIRSIPTVKVFVDGQPVDEFMGALPESALREFVARHLRSPAEPLRQAALDLIDAGQLDAALEKLGEASAIDPDNEAIRLDAVELLFSMNRAADAAGLLEFDYTQEAARATQLRQRQALLAEAGNLAPVDDLIRALETNPDDHATRLALAKALATRGDAEGAMAAALEVVRRDRQYDEGAGRRTLLQLFEVFGAHPEADDLVRRYRRALSAALH